MKRLIKFAYVLTVSLVICCCSTRNDQIKIGVIQYANQSILDSVYHGIAQKFNEYGHTYKMIYKVAHGDPILNSSIAKQLIKDSVDLIIALGTPSAQAVINGTQSIPIVFTAITDPLGAKLVQTMEKPGGNKTGLTNMQPFDKQVELIKLIKPDTKKVGIIINTSEANCTAGMTYVRAALDRLCIPYEELNATTSAEITACAQSLSNKCDVFFISPSNTLYENMGALKREAEKKNIMIVGGDKSAITQYGSGGTYSYDFVEMGINTAELAIDILSQHLLPGSIPVGKPKNTYLYLNSDAAEKLNLQIPESLKSISNK